MSNAPSPGLMASRSTYFYAVSAEKRPETVKSTWTGSRDTHMCMLGLLPDEAAIRKSTDADDNGDWIQGVSMHDDPAALLVRNLVEVFNERDEAKRLVVIRDLYTEHATFYESGESFQGYERINRRVSEVLQTIPPNALFRVAGPPTRNHNLTRLEWTLAAENEPTIASGMDVGFVEEDRISALYLFIDGA